MSVLAVGDAEHQLLVGFIDERGSSAPITLTLGATASSVLLVPEVPEAKPKKAADKDPAQQSRREKPDEYRPKMVVALTEAFDTPVLQLEVDTHLLSTDQLRFDLKQFISTALGYASEGYESIVLAPEDAERWGAAVLVSTDG